MPLWVNTLGVQPGVLVDEFKVEYKSTEKLVDFYEVALTDGRVCLVAMRPDNIEIGC